MDTSLLGESHQVEDEAELQKDSDNDDGILSKIMNSSEVRELKLKELPLVHQMKKKPEK
jgi:hypothetical protein